MSEFNKRSAYHRTFYTLPEKSDFLPSERETNVPSCDGLSQSCVTNNAKESCSLMSYINEGIIGKSKLFRGPFGDRKVLYCDWTASGKSLNFIEDFISSEVLPNYGNTHTTTSVTSLQTTLFRHEARDIIRNAVRASAEDAVIFVGSGCTGAIHKLIHNLHLDQPPIVIVGPFEHHSNILPWRHLAAKVLRAETDRSGMVSMESLQSLLAAECIVAEELGCKLIVCMTAASNVTGIMVDVNAVSSLIHRYGALAFWDYATAAPYVKMDMNPIVTGPDKDYVYKDAIYFSMHKFVGGPQTPGVLIAKRKLFKAGEVQPSGCGGGTVFFVRRDGHLYLKDVEEREEGGTPAIIESIRAGMVMQLKEAVTCEAIMQREDNIVKRVWQRLSDCDNLVVLGGNQAARLPIISVLIRHVYKASVDGNDSKLAGHCLFLHHNFVATLLNDLFGIQARGGCACAGPYAMDLLGIDEALARLYEEALLGCRLEADKYSHEMESPNREMIRPGFTRLSFPYFFTDCEIDFILDAIKFVANHGWVFLPLYRYNPSTAEWVHRGHDPGRDRKWLGDIKYAEGCMTWVSGRARDSRPVPCNEKACLLSAQDELYTTIKTIAQSPTSPVPDDTACLDEVAQDLRWFLLPSEAAAQLRNETHRLAVSTPSISPWQPGSLAACFCPASSSSTSAESRNLSDDVVQPSPGATANSVRTESPCQSCPPCQYRRCRANAVTIDVTRILPYNHRPPQLRTNAKDEVARHRPSDIFSPTNNSQNHHQHHHQQQQWDQEQNGSRPDDDSRGKDTDSLVISRRQLVTVAALQSLPVVQTDSCSVTHQPSPAFETVLSGEVEAAKGQVCNSANTRLDQSTVACRDAPRRRSDRKSPLGVQQADCKPAGGQSLWANPPRQLYKSVVDAIQKFRMIQPGDRVLVCLSGGKDSLSLLHCLRQYQNTPPPLQSSIYPTTNGSLAEEGAANRPWFSLGAVTVDPGTPAYDPRPLIPYLTELGVPYFYEEQGIIRQASNLPYRVSSICAFCSRMKRGRIYACARREGYNVVALGQHLDDVAESFLMSCFHNGLLLTMKANYTTRQKDLRVIRPLIFVREFQTRAFADSGRLPVIPENCPGCFQAPKERARIKRMLAEQEVLFPRLFPNLLATMMPLIGEAETRPQRRTDSQRPSQTDPIASRLSHPDEVVSDRRGGEQD